ncbi:hypothetical protein AB6834_00500, partial [Carnobacterium divergens]|uniref:hypothetical protein n=1 Tax=Carnobacterium divergens TaxID=2748 RepID=UPI0039BE05A7
FSSEWYLTISLAIYESVLSLLSQGIQNLLKVVLSVYTTYYNNWLFVKQYQTDNWLFINRQLVVHKQTIGCS